MRTGKVWHRFLLLALFCNPIPAPADPGYDLYGTGQDVENYYYDIPDPNPGGGIAQVITAGATLREEPSAYAQRVLTLKKGDTLFLLDRNKFIIYDEFQQPKEGWFHAVHVRTGKDGWVRSKHLKVDFTSFNPASLPLLQEPGENEYDNPRLQIINEASRTIHVRVDSKTYTLKPNASVELELEEGMHRYHAWAPRVIPASGQKSLRRGDVYTLTFFIVHYPAGSLPVLPIRRFR